MILKREYRMGQSARGFTLIELSIVLVIIGLIVGGVLVWQELIRAAEVRAMISDKDKVSTAIFTFKDKYSYLPSDLPNATTMLTTNTGYSIENGNGDGTIEDQCSVSLPWPINTEYLSIWPHLAAAGVLWTPLGRNFEPYLSSHYGHGVGYSFYNNSTGCDLSSSNTYGQTWLNFFSVGVPEGLSGALGIWALELRPQTPFPLTPRSTMAFLPLETSW